jgi:hypothetical protein
VVEKHGSPSKQKVGLVAFHTPSNSAAFSVRKIKVTTSHIYTNLKIS